MTQNTVRNITDIRDELIRVFDGLRDGTMAAKDAVEINNTAGKIISSAKVQLAYHALRGEAPDIPFLAAPVMVPALPAGEGAQAPTS
jgi:hypothetical protein